MADNNNQLAVQQPQQALTLKKYFDSEEVKSKFTAMLGKKAQGFITSVLQAAANNDKLKKADAMSIYNAACTAAAMDLPINNNLGFAFIVPYNTRVTIDGRDQWVVVAQFQMGYKGFVQLAMRTAQYKKINVIEVYSNQFKHWDALEEELDADFSKEGEGEIVGYCAYFRLLNGFEKVVYWSVEKIRKHAQEYSKSKNDKGDLIKMWKDNFDAMAKKTVLKLMLSKWGVLSVEMQMAIRVDQGVLADDQGTLVEYPDNPKNDPHDHERERAEILIAEAVTVAKLEAIQEAIKEQYPDLYNLAEMKKIHLANGEQQD